MFHCTVLNYPRIISYDLTAYRQDPDDSTEMCYSNGSYNIDCKCFDPSYYAPDGEYYLKIDADELIEKCREYGLAVNVYEYSDYIDLDDCESVKRYEVGEGHTPITDEVFHSEKGFKFDPTPPEDIYDVYGNCFVVTYTDLEKNENGELVDTGHVRDYNCMAATFSKYSLCPEEIRLVGKSDNAEYPLNIAYTDMGSTLSFFDIPNDYTILDKTYKQAFWDFDRDITSIYILLFRQDFRQQRI